MQLTHYMEEISRYESLIASRRFRNATNLTFVFMHDIDVVIKDKPLIDVVNETGTVERPREGLGRYSCRLCLKLGIFASMNLREDHVAEHCRSV